MSRMDFNGREITIKDLPFATTVRTKIRIIEREFNQGNISPEETRRLLQNAFDEFSGCTVDISEYQFGHVNLPQKEELIIKGMKLIDKIILHYSEGNDILNVDRCQLVKPDLSTPSKDYRGPWVMNRVTQIGYKESSIVLDEYVPEEDSYDEDGSLKQKDKINESALHDFLRTLPIIVPEDINDYMENNYKKLTNPSDEVTISYVTACIASNSYYTQLYSTKCPFKLRMNMDKDNKYIKGDSTPKWFIGPVDDKVSDRELSMLFIVESEETSKFAKELDDNNAGDKALKDLLRRRVYIPGTTGTINCIMRPIGYSVNFLREAILAI